MIFLDCAVSFCHYLILSACICLHFLECTRSASCSISWRDFLGALDQLQHLQVCLLQIQYLVVWHAQQLLHALFLVEERSACLLVHILFQFRKADAAYDMRDVDEGEVFAAADVLESVRDLVSICFATCLNFGEAARSLPASPFPNLKLTNDQMD